MTSFIELKKLIGILKNVRSNDISVEQAKESIGKLDWNTLDYVGEVCNSLEHFWDDIDIRGKDPDYASFQAVELDKLINHLEAQNFDAAAAISFLHTS